MSRYPFMEFAEQYLASYDGVFKKSTHDDLVRRYRRQSRIFVRLKDENAVTTTSPQRFTPDDIKTYIIHRRDSGVGKSDIARDICTLRHLCEFCGNTAVSLCLAAYPTLAPVRKSGARRASIAPADYDKFVDALPSVPDDWEHVRAYALVAMFLGTGARMQEMRYANISDLRLNVWEFDILHVKGLDSYGEPRTVPILPVFHDIIMRYVKSRAEWMEASGLKCPALFPSSFSEDGYLSANHLRRIRMIVVRELGFEFDYRMTRRTFGQDHLDSGLLVDTVSVLMGHSTTRTTEDYYCRQKNRVAIDHVRAVRGK